MSLNEIRTATITSRGQISLPSSIRKSESFSVGKKIAILTFDDRLEIRPMEEISEGLACTIASEKALAKDWLSEEDKKAWKNL